jgi:hypothetical protein
LLLERGFLPLAQELVLAQPELPEWALVLLERVLRARVLLPGYGLVLLELVLLEH